MIIGMTRTLIRMCGIVAAAAVALAGCGGSTTTDGSAPQATAPAAAASATASTSSCSAQAYAWAHSGGGITEMSAIGNDAGKISKDDDAVSAALTGGDSSASALAALTAAASALGADSQTALANQPPTCIGAAGPYREAMAQASQVAQDQLTAASDVSGGNYQGATSLLTASDTAMAKADGDLRKVTAAINSINGS